jgi:hypothetical protein
MKTVKRTELLDTIEDRFRANPIVMLLGPRQCGKTTLAREFAGRRDAEYFDLESPADAHRLDHPMTALEPLRGMVVIDEAQLRPELFPRAASSRGSASDAGKVLAVGRRVA